MLDDDALLEQGGMISVVLVAVVGVDGMCHVSADQEAILDGTLYRALLTLGQNASYSVNGVLHHRPSSSCKTHGQDYHRGVRGAWGGQGEGKGKGGLLARHFTAEVRGRKSGA